MFHHYAWLQLQLIMYICVYVVLCDINGMLCDVM